MEYQSFGRLQRPKGANIKQVLKVMLVFAACAWLVYQTQNLRNDNNNNRDEYSGQTKHVVGYGGAIPLGRKGVSSRIERRDLPDSGDVEKEVQPRELPNGVQLRNNAKSNFTTKENVEGKETKMQKNEESVTDADEEMKEVQIFHDENGVPPDGNEIVVGHAHILHEENISDVSNNKGSWLEMIMEGLKADGTTDEEINLGTIAHVDTSGIQLNSEIDEGNSLVL